MKKLLPLIFLAACSSGKSPAPLTPSDVATQAQIQNIAEDKSATLQLKGLDLLGVAMYCDAAIQAFPQGAALGAFYDTFGNSTGCLERIIQARKPSAIRIHLAWSDSHTFTSQQFDGIAAKASGIEGLARKYPAVRFYVSGACEHNLGSSDAKLLRAKVSAKCPHCAAYVNTPLHGALIDGINEVHGTSAAPLGAYFYSPDGTDLTNVDAAALQAKHAKAQIFFGWAPLFNLRPQGETRPPTQRTVKPSPDYIRSVARLTAPKGAAPKFSFNLRGLQAKELWKTHGENKGTLDPRADKPLFISRSNHSMQLVASNGKQVGALKYYGPYVDSGYFRAYADPEVYGFQIGQAALAASGSEWIAIRDGATNYGPLNPSFRAGYFQ